MTLLKYWDNTASEWKPFTGAIPAPTSSNVPRENKTGDNSTTAFTTSQPYVAGTLQVFINGLNQGSAYLTETDPLTGAFTLGTAPLATDDFWVSYWLAATGVGNADTVDNFHANAVPTANTLLPLQEDTIDANGWTVRQVGLKKMYTYKMYWTGSVSVGSNNVYRLPSIPLPVGISTRADMVLNYTASGNDRVWLFNDRGSGGSTSLNVEASNWYTVTLTLTRAYIDVIAWEL